MTRIFFYPDNTRYVLFTDQALSYMYAHAQRRPWQKEAGGEIFSSEPHSSGLVINTATGPNPSDYRRRGAWNPDTKASDRNRQIEFTHNRHVVGLWHTHPERFPSPSGRDQKTTWEYLDSFQGDRSRYLMVIIGNQGRIPSMAVWVASYQPRGEWAQLSEASSAKAGRVSSR
ncbi:Mov34/MPN/PAD-1 family protein [Pseudomonas sp. OTU5201]|uniref:Mov34/MPN/PAD-1 family protein n=1 Tax=Pseudomonas sp. OTU5201 TaxID=3043850 RepID=UPI00406C9F08